MPYFHAIETTTQGCHESTEIHLAESCLKGVDSGIMTRRNRVLAKALRDESPTINHPTSNANLTDFNPEGGPE